MKRFAITTLLCLGQLCLGLFVPTVTVAQPAEATAALDETLSTFQGLPIKFTRERSAAWVAQYAGFAKHKAVAIALDEDGTWAMGWGQKQASILPAIGAALGGCERSRQERKVAAQCELARVDERELELGRAFVKRMNVGATAKPAIVWRFKRGATELHLAGSIHVFKSSLYPLPAAYEQAYVAADTLVLEVNMAGITPQDLMALRKKYMLLPEGKKLDELLPETMLAEVKAAAAELGVPWQALENLQPAALAVELLPAFAMTEGIFPQHGIDAHFLGRALQQTKEVRQLETAELQLELLSKLPIDLQLASSESALDTSDLSETLNGMLEAWYTADLPRIAKLSETGADKNPKLREWLDKLFAERNVGMADGIAALLDGKPKKYFVLIGAGHLAGKGNVLELLAKKGFKGEQLNRDGSVALAVNAAAMPK